MSDSIVSLPMYDWPELQSANDRFFAVLKQSLLDHGFSAPDGLNRSAVREDIWQSDELLLSQTCGLPLVTLLKDKVSIVGTPAYGIECGAGSYFSVVVVHKNSDLNSLSDLKTKTFTYNEKGSQSGYMAFLHLISPLDNAHKILVNSVQSGGHRQSIQDVAAGKADFAAIDTVSWELALRHEPAAGQLRVIATTKPTPALPFISALRRQHEIEKIHVAVSAAMASLDETTREELMLIGFMPATFRDYGVIENRWRQMEAMFASGRV